MAIGLVLGKFNPLHIGHIGLIEFAQKHCEELIVLVCASNKENIAGPIRLKWIQESFNNNPNIKPILLCYSEDELPNTSISSREISKIWASKLKTIFPRIDIIFSSEEYGQYLAENLNCNHITFDLTRSIHKISSSEIILNNFRNWEYIAPHTRQFFVKKICLYGTESTGKSTLTKNLANYFQTEFVPEMAREIIEETEECTEAHLIQIAEIQARAINEKIKIANRLLFVDTDLNITSSYSRYLFKKELIVEDWVKQANNFDLYLYLDNDAPHIQDGTRLDKQRRDELNKFHLKQLTDEGIKFELINGNWEERFEKSISIINKLMG